MSQKHYYTLIEAASAWQCPIGDVVQLASQRTIKAYAVADNWSGIKPGLKLDGWVEIDHGNLLKSLDKDHVMITRARETGNSVWLSLEAPKEKRWGSVYVDQVTFEKHQGKQTQTTHNGSHYDKQTDERMIASKEAARLLGIQPDTLSKWRQKGKGPRYQNFGRTVKYRESDVRAYLDDQSSE